MSSFSLLAGSALFKFRLSTFRCQDGKLCTISQLKMPIEREGCLFYSSSKCLWLCLSTNFTLLDLVLGPDGSGVLIGQDQISWLCLNMVTHNACSSIFKAREGQFQMQLPKERKYVHVRQEQWFFTRKSIENLTISINKSIAQKRLITLINKICCLFLKSCSFIL